MKIQLIALSLCVLASTNLVKGQEHSKGFTPSENKHEIRLSVSDGLTQGSVDILGMGLADAVTGSKLRMKTTVWCMDLVTAIR